MKLLYAPVVTIPWN